MEQLKRSLKDAQVQVDQLKKQVEKEAKIKNDLAQNIRKQSKALDSLKRALKTVHDEKVIKIYDRKFQKDTIDIYENKEVVLFERENQIKEIDNSTLGEIMGRVTQFYVVPGYRIFVVYDGESLNLEYCNQSANIYIVKENGLDMDDTVVKVSTYSQIDIVEVQKNIVDYNNTEYILVYENGRYPKKIQKLNLNTFKFI
ncbi:hypothetical protein [Flammeovirga sp. SJP92]|uniref:hypothetical protein n=1 Tax=Flammeovirga sp. SJP92 TaxID=1775430 RepID=UPI0007884C2B|nr:hypothetical protein [Flammeovirga sp. SJP92]KXX69643.1 hypothetical protein AVL50_15390 [Flammeovirga sp. SJP92]